MPTATRPPPRGPASLPPQPPTEALQAPWPELSSAVGSRGAFHGPHGPAQPCSPSFLGGPYHLSMKPNTDKLRTAPRMPPLLAQEVTPFAESTSLPLPSSWAPSPSFCGIGSWSCSGTWAPAPGRPCWHLLKPTSRTDQARLGLRPGPPVPGLLCHSPSSSGLPSSAHPVPSS